MTFEQALTRLEELVSGMENDTLTLEESLKAYEEGVKLAAFCEKALGSARLKVSELQQPQQDSQENE